MKMRKIYEKPQVEMFEVASEQGFAQSDFNAGFIVPGGGNYGDENDWV